jgi:aminoglycoside phosphotransferase (APT) family kinase protein
VTITRWLLEQGFPAIEPIDVDQPVAFDGAVVTFWRHYPQNDRAAPGAGALGALLRRLHELPQPPVALDEYVPLAHLGSALESDLPLSDEDRSWLADRREQLLAEYGRLDSALGIGFVHGDAYPGNTLWDGQLVRLGDWDEVARGPRELDLVNTHQGARFGRSADEQQAFTDAYGWDVTTWPGYPILREMRDVHTLGAFGERAGRGDDAAAAELRHRVATLRAGDASARWHAS